MALFSKKNLKSDSNKDYVIYTVEGSLDYIESISDLYSKYVHWEETELFIDTNMSEIEIYNEVTDNWENFSKKIEHDTIFYLSYYPFFTNKCKSYILRNDYLYRHILNKAYPFNVDFIGLIRVDNQFNDIQILYEHLIFRVVK